MNEKTRPHTLRRFLNADILPRVAVILLGIPCLYFITLRGGLFSWSWWI